MGSGSDDDFDDLDDYLDDFADEILDAPFKSAKKTNDETGHNVEKSDGNAAVKDEDNLTEEELSKQIDANMAALFGDSYKDPQTKDQLAKLMGDLAENFDIDKFLQDDNDGLSKEATNAMNYLKESVDDKAKDGNPVDFKNVIASTVSRLKEQDAKVDQSIKEEEKAKSAEKGPEELLSALLKEMNLEGAPVGDGASNPEGDFDISKLLVDMVSKLTTKDMLYEPMKNLSDKLPKWIEENKDKESVLSEDLSRYQTQQKLATEIVAIFEKPSYNDNDATDREEVSKRLEMLQEAGMPPPELKEDFPAVPGLEGGFPGLNFNPESLGGSVPGIPDNGEGCEQQ